jgi:hypothetical protein
VGPTQSDEKFAETRLSNRNQASGAKSPAPRQPRYVHRNILLVWGQSRRRANGAWPQWSESRTGQDALTSLDFRPIEEVSG